MRNRISRLKEVIVRPRAKAGMLVILGTAAGAAASLLAGVFAARELSIDAFAAFGVGLAINSLTTQFGDLGMGTMAMVEAEEGEEGRRRRLTGLALRRLLAALVASGLIAVVVLVVPSFSPYRDIALIAAVGAAIGTCAMFMVGVLQSYRRFAAAGSVQFALGITRLACVAAAALAGGGAAAMMAGYAAVGPAVAILVGLVALFRYMRERLPEAGETALEAASTVGGAEEIAAQSARGGRRREIASIALFGALLLNLDVLLLTAFGDEEAVATYSAAWRIAAGVMLFNAALSSAITPFVLAAWDAGREIRQLVRGGLLLTVGWLILAAPMTALGVLMLGSVGDAAATPLVVLLIAFAIDGFFSLTHLIMYRLRRERVLAIIVGVRLLVMTGVTLLLREQGEMAPAYGQLAAAILGVVVMGALLLPAVSERTGWFGQIADGDELDGKKTQW